MRLRLAHSGLGRPDRCEVMPGQPCDFDSFRGQVYGWAFRLLGNTHDSQDVVQDVYLRWNRQLQVARPVQPRGWLRRVTVNCAIDACRKLRGREFSRSTWRLERDDSDDWDGKAEPESMATDGANLDVQALRADVAAALEGLTDVQRSVTVAKIYEQLTFAAIAAELGLSVSTVKTHYVRAVRNLSKSLRPRWAEDGDGSHDSFGERT